MEKLIELLNEYEKEKGLHTFWKTAQSNKIQIYGKGICSESYLYSKSYGFIKWLVENEKINKDLISRVLIRACVSPKNLVALECEFYDYYESLLMLLSIQDEPIEFLVSILK